MVVSRVSTLYNCVRKAWGIAIERNDVNYLSLSLFFKVVISALPSETRHFDHFPGLESRVVVTG